MFPRHKWIIVALTICLIFVTSPPVNAHYVYENEWAYRSDRGHCVRERSEISHGDGGGYSKVDAIISHYWYFDDKHIPCGLSKYKSAGEILIKWDLMKWNASRAEWHHCRVIDSVSNRTRTYKFVVYAYYGAYADCGTGWYGTWGSAKVWNGRTFKGGRVWSGPHWLEG